MNTEVWLEGRARRLHQASLAHVPVSVSTRLHPAEPERNLFWKPVAVAAALGVAVLGVTQFQQGVEAPPQTTVAHPGSSPAATVASPATAFDNDPEFYAWLGSDSVAQLEE